MARAVPDRADPMTLLSARTTTGAGSWVKVGRALPGRLGVAVHNTAGTASVQLQGRINSGSTFAVSLGAATTAGTTPRIVTLSTAIAPVTEVRARVTLISSGSVTVLLTF